MVLDIRADFSEAMPSLADECHPMIMAIAPTASSAVNALRFAEVIMVISLHAQRQASVARRFAASIWRHMLAILFYILFGPDTFRPDSSVVLVVLKFGPGLEAVPVVSNDSTICCYTLDSKLMLCCSHH